MLFHMRRGVLFGMKQYHLIFVLSRVLAPRHACFDSQGRYAYLITELSAEVIVLPYDGKTLHPVQTVLPDTVGAHGSADIYLSSDGKN